MFDFTVLLRDFDMFEAVDVMFFDKRNNLIGAQVNPLFGFGVSDEDGAVDLSLSDEIKFFEAMNSMMSVDVYQASKIGGEWNGFSMAESKFFSKV